MKKDDQSCRTFANFHLCSRMKFHIIIVDVVVIVIVVIIIAVAMLLFIKELRA